MYDFEAEAEAEAEPASSADSRCRSKLSGQPPILFTALEFPRWVGEYGASRAVDIVGRADNAGEGRPVLVLPGFSANDVMTGRLRGHLRQRGFVVHPWRLGRNIGLTDRLVDGLSVRFAEIAEQHDEPVSIVGWSFGGLLARRLAHEHPDQVRQIICLGSPWRTDGERTRATAMFERSRVRYGMSERARPIIDQLREPVPVPTTAIWSRTDGVTSWRGCSVDEARSPIAENVEVPSSHVGMVANPLVLAVVVNRLRQVPERWQSFRWRDVFRSAPSKHNEVLV